MGCSCCRPDKHNLTKEYTSVDYGQGRLHLSMGLTQIQVKQAHLYDSDAQCLVSVIDNKAIGGGSTLLKHFKETQKTLPIIQQQQYNYGTVIPLVLDSAKDRQGVFLVLPLWKGDQKQILVDGIMALIDYLRANNIKSVAIEEIGVDRLGYPRQIVVESLIECFDGMLNSKNVLESVCFTSTEMSTVGLFEQRIKTIIAKDDDLIKQQTQLKKSSFSLEGKQSQTQSFGKTKTDLHQPLLSN